MRWTDEQVADYQRRNAQPYEPNRVPPAKTKFNNIRGEVNGKKTASKLEGERYMELLELEKYGEIEGLRFQQPFPLLVNDMMIGSYVADYVYVDKRSGRRVVEDAKGSGDTPLFRWKAKHFAAQYGFEITIVRKS